jgi:hypothetical protein
MGINGLLTDVRWEWTGTEVTTNLITGTTVLPVLDPEAITEGENVWIAETGPYEILDADVDASTFTITPGLEIDVDAQTEVATDIGGQPGRAWICEVVLADADVPVEVPLTVHDLAVMPEGTYDPPVVIVLSDDLERVENLPGSLPVVDGVYILPDSLPPPASSGNNVYRQDDPPWPEGTPGMPDNDLWYDTDHVDDAGNVGVTPFLWDATNMVWLDVSDPKVDELDDPGNLLVGDSTLDQMQNAIVNTNETATSAQSLASTADGRISMSDYDPTAEDVSYYVLDSEGALAKGSRFQIINKQLTSSVATLTIDPLSGGAMTMNDGEWIVVEDVGAPFDGEWQITAHTTADPLTVSYRIGGAADVASTVIDPYATGYNTLIQDRVEGSLWFTRTRARKNFCTNPSFEVDLAGWASVAATMVRVPDLTVIAGGYVAQITNDGTTADHRAEWTGGTPGFVVEEAQVWADTCFALAVSGTNTGCYASVRYYDAADALIVEVPGPVVDLDTVDWRELKVDSTAPPLGTHMAAIVLHNPNPGAVWKIDGALVENADYTGRYFDGDSAYAEWLGTPDQSASEMDGGQIVSVYELYDNNWVRMDFTGTTQYNADASDLLTGTLDPDRLADNSIPVWKLLTNSVRVSDAVTAGQVVNVWNNNGVFMVRPADASVNGKQADGFVRVSAAVGASVPVYALGYINTLSGLSPGLQFLQTTPGTVGIDVPNVAGQVIQQVGYADDAKILHFNPQQPILLN